MDDVRTTAPRVRRGARYTDLGSLARLAEEACGLDLRSLRPGQSVVVRTHNSTYTVRLADPARATAVVTGDGSFLSHPTDATIVGATLTGRGSSVATARVLVGFRLVISCPDGELITSRVQAISVDGMPWVSEYRHL